MKALVTGGAGFIGSHIVTALATRGDDVVVIDDCSTGLRSRMETMAGGAVVIEGDIRDADVLTRAMAGCDVVFHQAALGSVERSIHDPAHTNDVNTRGTIQVMLAAARSGVSKVIYASSSSAYGMQPGLPRRETQRPDPRSPYAISKLAAEGYVRSLGEIHGIDTVVLRYFNVFGPGQDLESRYAAVVPRFIRAALLGMRPIVYGDGTQARDFTFVANVVSANLLAADQPDTGSLVLNIGCGARSSLLELLQVIGNSVGRRQEPIFEAARPGDVLASEASIGLARERLGYQVLVPFEPGIRETVAWYAAHLGESHGYRPTPFGRGRSTAGLRMASDG
jgi:UDP-glucose 4-epimerase